MWIAIIVIFLLGLVYFFKFASHFPRRQDLAHRPDFFGVTFSKKYCASIGIDWKETYLAMLDDLQVKYVRLPIYWDDIEKEKGVLDYADYDYMISEGARRDVKFIINIGWRLPRWPECHAPLWATENGVPATQAAALDMLKESVERYKDNSAVIAWQVENEPLLNTFGVCPPADINFLQKEIALVRQLDKRPIMISSTGELSAWKKEAKLGDMFGSTLYRVVWGPWTGYVRYPIPAWFYRLKADLAGIRQENRFIVELQAEPWVPEGSIMDLTKKEAAKSLNMEQFRANLQYAINVNFQQTYLWGVEWWYAQYLRGEKEYWDLAKTVFK